MINAERGDWLELSIGHQHFTTEILEVEICKYGKIFKLRQIAYEIDAWVTEAFLDALFGVKIRKGRLDE